MNTPNLPCKSFYGYGYFGVQFTAECACFRLLEPNADCVFLTGDFCDWQSGVPMTRDAEGVWECVMPRETLFDGCKYKYRAVMRDGSERFIADPYEMRNEEHGGFASVVCDINTYRWRDATWIEYREKYKQKICSNPLSIYKFSADLWCAKMGGMRSYAQLSAEIAPYVKQLGCTHVQLASVLASSSISRFAPRTFGGHPTELMAFVDSMHEAGLGVIFELPIFDGQAAYTADSCAFWLDKYHADGLCILDQTPSEYIIADLKERFSYAIFICSESNYADGFDLILTSKPDRINARPLPLCSYEAFAWDSPANIGAMRLAFERLMASPCKKLIVMGYEIGQAGAECDGGVDWSLLCRDEHVEFQRYASELGQSYLSKPQT